MITIELGETHSGSTITILAGLDAEKYDLNRVKRALRKLSKCEKSKLTDDNEIILSGSHIKLCNEFITRIGF